MGERDPYLLKLMSEQKYYQLGRIKNTGVSTALKLDNKIIVDKFEEDIFNYATLVFTDYMDNQDRKQEESLRSKDAILNRFTKEALFHNTTDPDLKNPLIEDIFGFCLARNYQDIKPFDMYYNYLSDYEKYKINKYLNINFLDFLNLPFYRVEGIIEFANRLLSREMEITNKQSKILERQHDDILSMKGSNLW